MPFGAILCATLRGSAGQLHFIFCQNSGNKLVFSRANSFFVILTGLKQNRPCRGNRVNSQQHRIIPQDSDSRCCLDSERHGEGLLPLLFTYTYSSYCTKRAVVMSDVPKHSGDKTRAMIFSLKLIVPRDLPLRRGTSPFPIRMSN